MAEVSSTMIKVNGTALMNEFKKRGLNPADIAQSFGYARSYFATSARNNALRASLAELLWNEYNIPLDAYKDGNTVESGREGYVDYDKIYEVSKKAFVDALNDSMTGMYATIYGAIKKAQKEANGDG